MANHAYLDKIFQPNNGIKIPHLRDGLIEFILKWIDQDPMIRSLTLSPEDLDGIKDRLEHRYPFDTPHDAGVTKNTIPMLRNLAAQFKVLCETLMQIRLQSQENRCRFADEPFMVERCDSLENVAHRIELELCLIAEPFEKFHLTPEQILEIHKWNETWK